ncbi:hypothetical protein ABW20_dc0108265 [Dactylellina cionopaga]|nr:hypothetical protein ABW20_dc0108265 [Dactylellina cionopaga]
MSDTSSSSPIDNVLLLPMKVDAFVLNEAVCSGDEALGAKIAPITQPNYTFLRLTDFYIQSDILNQTDLHYVTPADCNSRFTDLGTGEKHANREGVYIHWTVPRPYRTGTRVTQTSNIPEDPKTTTKTPADPKDTTKAPADPSKTDPSTASYQNLPNRWLVVRLIQDKKTIFPAEMQSVVPQVDAWIVESDRMSTLDQLDESVDLQVDVSPFISAAEGAAAKIDDQAEVFIGWKESARTWTEAETPGKPPKKPRVALSLLNSSNQLFTDFQPHNSNVLSIVDTFTYDVKDGKNSTPKKVHSAKASYYVIGWHMDPSQDPMYVPAADAAKADPRSARMGPLGMVLGPAGASIATNWEAEKDSARILCHGAMYDVMWDAKNLPHNVPANDACKHLTEDLPISIGATPMDALLAYVRAHMQTDVDTVQELETSLYSLHTLLRSQDDSVESQREAKDLLVNTNFSLNEGGLEFHLSQSSNQSKDGKPVLTPPSDKIRHNLQTLNSTQKLLDASLRKLKYMKWKLFSLWWTYLSDVRGETRDTASQSKKEVQTHMTEANALVTSIISLNKTVEKLKPNIPNIMAGATGHFSQQKDPTMMILNPASSAQESAYMTPLLAIAEKLPADLQDAATVLLKEFNYIQPENIANVDIGPNAVAPLYHDQDLASGNMKDTELPWRDRWEKTQPWLPLFLEWEIEYTDVPFEYWSLEERTTANAPANPKLRYGIKSDIVLYDLAPQPQPQKKAPAKDEGSDPKAQAAKPNPPPTLTNTRKLSGRVLILPQPNFSLKTKVDQLISQTPAKILEGLLNDDKSDDKLNALKTELYRLQFLSAPLSGFNDHLATRLQGSHIKPNTRPPGQANRPLSDALQTDAGFGISELTMIGAQSDLTPYGFQVEVPKDQAPFHPVAHGQFKITKLNIIDKFGQAIHAAKPTPAIHKQPRIYPILSEFYEPQIVPKPPATEENVVNGILKDDPGKCEFAQVTPRINQMARLNSTFVTLNVDSPKKKDILSWNPVDDWTNPIWGWLVTNYADCGIQLFTNDGEFYREIRFGGPSGTQDSPAWLPFPPPTSSSTTVNTWQQTLLEQFAQLLTNKSYLQAVVWMLDGASKISPPAPSAYAEFLNSIIGRPIALVNMAWWLELAAAPYQNQSKLNTLTPSMTLCGDSSTNTTQSSTSNDKTQSGASQDETENVYNFQVKLGDENRMFDGLIGYFDGVTGNQQNQNLDANNLLQMNTIKTFFTNIPEANTTYDKSQDPRKKIDNSTYPSFQARYVDPAQYSEDASSYDAARQLHMSVFGAMVDPFVSIHAYSSILPIQVLTLPPWTWQQAMKNMTGFFHMGPILVTQDVPPYNAQNKLAADYSWATTQNATGPDVAIPAVSQADWAWLQPYIDPTVNTQIQTAQKSGSDSAKDLDPTAYMSLGIGKVDATPNFANAPYTAIEGYLQLKKPIMRVD